MLTIKKLIYFRINPVPESVADSPLQLHGLFKDLPFEIVQFALAGQSEIKYNILTKL